MLYFLQDKNIIFKDTIGQLKCVDFEHDLYLRNPTANFIQKDFYQRVVYAIDKTFKTYKSEKESDILILNSRFLSYPGLVESIINQVGVKTTIQSDLEFVISSQDLQPGEYALIDICENESCLYNFLIDNNGYLLVDKTKLDNAELKGLLANRFASSQTDILFTSLFNYSNVILANSFITTNEVTDNLYERYTLCEINDTFSIYTGITFKDLFEGISSSIIEFINPHISTGRLLLIKSALTGFRPIKSFLSSYGKINVINELDILSSAPLLGSIKCKTYNGRFELNCYPKNKKVVFPFSSWIVSEIENLQIELIEVTENGKVSFQINLSDLKEKFSDTVFSIDSKQLVKYLIKLQTDTCNNFHLKIETLNKEEFYYLIHERTDD